MMLGAQKCTQQIGDVLDLSFGPYENLTLLCFLTPGSSGGLGQRAQ